MFEDENIIAQRNEEKKALAYTIENELDIDGMTITFSEKVLFEDSFSIVLPDQFKIMDEERAKLKYPSEFRPDLIYTDESGSINFSFSYVDTELLDTQVATMAEDMQAVQKRMNPANVFMDEGSIEAKNREVGYFTFRSYAFDADLFNWMFVTNIDNLFMMGVFNCIYEQRDSWIPLVKQMLATINDLKKREDDKDTEG